MSKIYFKGLNEIRALAAFGVVFFHLELYSVRNNVVSLYDSNFFEYFIVHLGTNGVYLFFVLSGFLITYLLLNEKETTKTISIKNFYIRRVFRIWPLYFILVFIALLLPFLVSNTTFFDSETYYINLIKKEELYQGKNLFLYLFFLSNFAKPIVAASQSWSVSVEEQFYLIWPHFVKQFSKAKLLLVFTILIVTLLVIQIFKLPFSTYISRIPLEIMAIGGVIAYFWYHYKSKMERYFKSNALFFLNIILIGIGLFFPMPKLLLAVLFGLFILFVISERTFNLRSSKLSFFGKISYGIYMYHPLMMFIASAISNKLISNNAILYKISFYSLTLIFTYIVSYYSYQFIEKRLLQYKDSKFNTL